MSDAMTTVQRERQNALLELLQFSLKTGCCGILRNKIAIFGSELLNSCDPDIRVRYRQVVSAAEEAFRIEAIHGRGSLLDLDHPVVIDLIGEHVPRDPAAISPEEIEAARRYRSLTA